MRWRKVVKFLKAIDLIARHGGATIEELSEGLEIDRRSVYRLLDVIEEIGIPIYDDKYPMDRKKRWKIEESYLKKLPNIGLPDLKLTLSELIALYFVKGYEKIYQGTEIEKKVDSAFKKIDTFVPAGLSEKLDKIKTLFIPSSKLSKDYSGKEKIIESLTDAMLLKKICRIKYHSFYDDAIKEFKADPLYFFENGGGLYIFANALAFKKVITLAVERIENLEVTDLTFEYPKGFNPEENLSTAFRIIWDDPVKAKIWFSKAQARYIKERKWAKEQRIIENKDGSIILEMKTSGFNDVKRWVLSCGADARVIEPEKLKKEIIKELAAAEGNYKNLSKQKT